MKAEYEAVFSSPMGQRVLKDIKLSAGVEKEIFSSDIAVMSMNEGKRQLGIHILYMATPRAETSPEEAKT